MKETEAQSLFIAAIRERKGFAHKMSNRFMAGVSDILLKQPLSPAALLEAKLRKFKISPHTDWKLDVTKLQREFLEKAWRAGMKAGVVSFVGTRADKLWMAIVPISSLIKTDMLVTASEHVELGDIKTRTDRINMLVRAFCDG